MKTAGRWLGLLPLLLLVVTFRGCYPEGTLTIHRGFGVDASIPTPAGLDGGESIHAAGVCAPVHSVEPEVARTAVMSGSAVQQDTMYVADLFPLFTAQCGKCHEGLNPQGSYTVNQDTFAQVIGQTAVDRIFSDDLGTIMPPPPDETVPASKRNPATDAVLQLGTLIRAWVDQGKRDPFFPPQAPTAGDGGAPHSYLLSETVGKALSNLGNCIPNKALIGIQNDALDDFFEKAKALPQRLDQTDITTFDSTVLAAHGVVAYAPTYPLWSDNARKIRYVRVPRGKSIVFDKAAQQFRIPDNTRFYKTFLKEVIEKDGAPHYRKIETRLIVARADTNDANGVATAQNALFGTYKWNDSETEALLVQVAYKDGTGFADVLEDPYTTDEIKDAAIRAQKTADGAPLPADQLEKALIAGGAARHYAIPGSQRCVQCHMGSPSQSFVLGFTPLQINRRPLGVGGIIEDASQDDLSQLQRLVEYGVITGLADPADVVHLEDSEGARKPRNNYELIAQGYMVGNCAHCHNERGFPTVTNPVLAGVLDFLPGTGAGDGIFQFPLETTSPRIFRDLGNLVPIPYITPSFVDYPGRADYDHMVDHPNADVDNAVSSGGRHPELAPWRSLIYRNVDTPFPYADDLALFPHMPMNTPGYDCRAAHIMADWMLSIPAVRKRPDIAESTTQSDGVYPKDYSDPALAGLHENGGTDTEPQPYVETPPGSPRYGEGLASAQRRLAAYHEGGNDVLPATGAAYVRYKECPDTNDIVDPTVSGKDLNHATPSDVKFVRGPDGSILRVPMDYEVVPSGLVGQPNKGQYSEDGQYVGSNAPVVWPDDGVPDRPHWVPTDLTDDPPPWAPRNHDWEKVLVKHSITDPNDPGFAVPSMLNPVDPNTPGITLTDGFRKFAVTPIPFGLWKAKSQCNFSKSTLHIDQVSAFKNPATDPAHTRPRWMDVANASNDDWVYSQYPGAAVFNMVCINCHGPKADGQGRQAATLALMTGGNARVANLRAGLFGPIDNPGDNRTRVFGPDATNGVTPDDLGARYMAWMALGGTVQIIPKSILNVVAATPILGVPRTVQVDSANMLGAVKTLCQNFANGYGLSISSSDIQEPWSRNAVWNAIMHASAGSLITQNGDAELWARLCSLDNPTPVAALALQVSGSGTPASPFKPDHFDFERHSATFYPPSTPIGNAQGLVDPSLNSDNVLPWCVFVATDTNTPEQAAYGASFLAGSHTADGKKLPVCPPEISAANGDSALGDWSTRAAINGGLAVFEYLNEIVKNGYTPVPPYDQCENLTYAK